MSYTVPPWDEGEGSRDAWKNRVSGARKRATSGYLQADMVQGDLPLGDSLLRLLTIRFGEHVQHWLDDPIALANGQKRTLVENCAAPVDYIGDKSDLCPLCVYGIERGNRINGGVDTQHWYYILAVIGKIETVMYKDSTNPAAPAVPTQEVVWDYEPKIFGCTGPLYNAMFRRLDDIDFPVGAGGDITKYAFRITKTQSSSAKQSIRYTAEPYGEVSPIPAEVDTAQLKPLWEKLRKICEPAKAEILAQKMGVQINPLEMETPVPYADESAHGSAIADPPAQKIGGADLELEDPVGAVGAMPSLVQAATPSQPAAPAPAPTPVPAQAPAPAPAPKVAPAAQPRQPANLEELF